MPSSIIALFHFWTLQLIYPDPDPDPDTTKYIKQ